MNKHHSLYVQLLLLLVISAVISGSIFAFLNLTREYMNGYYYNDESYIDHENQKYIGKLQRYIDSNQIEKNEVQKLKPWIKKQGLLSIQIYFDGVLHYDSEYTDQESIQNENIRLTDYDWNQYYTVKFADGEGQVSMYGSYGYKIYMLSGIVSACISFAVFLVLVICGIRKKMKYISELSKEIEILEGGNLDYPVAVIGHDELASLARGLDDMRISFQEQTVRETHLVQENQRIITEMSHDIRTPITAVMLYTEILRKGAYKDEKQLKEYIEKIDYKCRRMKQLTDNLFEYSLVTGETEIDLEEPESYEVIFYDLFSETGYYLEQEGFQIAFKVEWIDEKIQISGNYLGRIMDNITSNIIKYADRAFPVTVSSLKEKNTVGFSFTNTIRASKEGKESTEIGLHSIRNMMSKMGGRCETQKKENNFCIQLLFPCVMER
ncbi:MAG: HAMP domain-containing sensor histidine kinase [Lachnospiraceae bacterium]|nr:HAMP domain-containing sensor histidine kinase [Lachnospiraceae bacterium]